MAGFAVSEIVGFGVLEGGEVYVDVEGYWEGDSEPVTLRLVLFDDPEENRRFAEEFSRTIDAALQALAKLEEKEG